MLCKKLVSIRKSLTQKNTCIRKRVVKVITCDGSGLRWHHIFMVWKDPFRKKYFLFLFNNLMQSNGFCEWAYRNYVNFSKKFSGLLVKKLCQRLKISVEDAFLRWVSLSKLWFWKIKINERVLWEVKDKRESINKYT